jgi:hypothetical protein
MTCSATDLVGDQFRQGITDTDFFTAMVILCSPAESAAPIHLQTSSR